MRYLLTLLLLAAGCTAARAHGDSTQYLFPVRQVAGLYSANFGELRPGHFHGGVDIKTDGAVGKELVAVADGYVSRLSVAPGGYGRALYITLRNGHTAVYGHILRFRDDLEQRVDAERRRTRRNSVNLWFRPDEFPVAQATWWPARATAAHRSDRTSTSSCARHRRSARSTPYAWASSAPRTTSPRSCWDSATPRSTRSTASPSMVRCGASS